MTQLSFESCVAVHRQNQLAGEANDAPGALNEGTAKGLDLSKAPKSGAFRGRTALARIEPHLKLASEVVSKNTGEHVQLIPDPRLDRHVAHLAVRLELDAQLASRYPPPRVFIGAITPSSDTATVHAVSATSSVSSRIPASNCARCASQRADNALGSRSSELFEGVMLPNGKDALLRAPSFVEENDRAWIDFLVGHDNLELVSVLDGLKQIELNGELELVSVLDCSGVGRVF